MTALLQRRDLSLPTFAFPDGFRQMQFAMMDTQNAELKETCSNCIAWLTCDNGGSVFERDRVIHANVVICDAAGEPPERGASYERYSGAGA